MDTSPADASEIVSVMPHPVWEVLASAKSSGSVFIPLFVIAVFAVVVIIGIRTAIDQRRPKNRGASFSPREIRSPLEGISKGAFPALGRVRFGSSI